MKKILLSAAVIVSFSLYAWQDRFGQAKQPLVTQPSSLSANNFPPANIPINSTPSNQPSPAAKAPAAIRGSTTTPAGKYKNGQYTGPVTDAYYGNVQVAVTISNGKISDVQFLQYPNDRSHSIDINTQAMPYLRAEALQAQSANVDIVSGATATSEAFIQSLGTALAQA